MRAGKGQVQPGNTMEGRLLPRGARKALFLWQRNTVNALPRGTNGFRERWRRRRKRAGAREGNLDLLFFS